MIEVRWHGRGGQGSFTAARLLGSAAALFENKYSLSFPSFGPERRGAPVLGFTKIDDTKIFDRSEVKESDYVIILDETLINKDILNGIKKGAKIIINTKDASKYTIFNDYEVYAIDATTMALNILKRPITNTAMLGALIGASEVVSLESAKNAIKSEMKESLIEKNIKILEIAYNEIKKAVR
ncbi:pyruvate ferredoxin oxidoreductase subunit gamma [Tepiditoga spiralis]|uniref:Pyruvate ferredoxin oxidoreductase subunit gamma n=1 Tax=Tepiditoga spiralis TaxID=2108365 RepID=A0A7G1G9G4_9BACT|nr:2-oxoacid:acceptor oxidoreductase family protein [Tepiditoga spiralis]BBE29969.1 pyruvate ferredoxin oxidoreductase subunit gamma [Tepiditoga spiralis]